MTLAEVKKKLNDITGAVQTLEQALKRNPADNTVLPQLREMYEVPPKVRDGRTLVPPDLSTGRAERVVRLLQALTRGHRSAFLFYSGRGKRAVEPEEPVSLQRIANLLWELGRTVQDVKRDVNRRFDRLEERLNAADSQLRILGQEQERLSRRIRATEQAVEANRLAAENGLDAFGALEHNLERAIDRAAAAADCRLDRLETTLRDIGRELEKMAADLRALGREWRIDTRRDRPAGATDRAGRAADDPGPTRPSSPSRTMRQE
ncbi:MAG: hypothetical protein QJR01_04965 [Kyrpidia sp.]|nr:hypothetical protein [Kyrpidia sp.]